MTTRRQLLRSLGLGAAAAPFIPLLPSHAGVEAPPRRVVVVHFGHGVAYDRWLPPGPDTALQPSPILDPLAAFLDRTVVLSGLANAAGREETGDVHNIGLGTLLTSTGLAADQGAGGHYLPGGPSIDRVIGDGLVAQTGGALAHPALHFGVRSEGFAIAAQDRGVPIRAEDDPLAHYERVFGELALDPAARAAADKRRADLRRFVKERVDTLAPGMPTEDRDALERHRDAVATLEQRVAMQQPPPDTCVLPEAPSAIDAPATPANDDIPTLIAQTNALVTASLACDRTRVATVQWGSSGNDGLRHVWQGIDTDYHSIAHLANGRDPTAHEQLAAMNTWYSEQLADLAARLDAVDEGDGTLLDHTVLVFLSSFSVVHDMANLPIVLVGGGLAGARHLRFDGESVTGLWLSLAHHLGLDELTAFGDPSADDGPLAGVV
ncbi:MAG: DUF1552 domain-containing protein [Myxococcota bacterium]